MGSIRKEQFIATAVMIEFEDGPVSFLIKGGATLAEVSENLDKIRKWHKGKPLSIDVRFKVQKVNSRARALGNSLIASSVFQPGATPVDASAHR